MKRFWICTLMLLAAAAVCSAALEATITRVEENGRLLVPVRGVFELTGATVDWNGYDRSVEVAHGSDFITMWVNNHTAMVNGYEAYLDVPPRNISGRVHIPLRFVGEALGRTVNYTGNTVYIAAPGAEDIILHIVGGRNLPPPPSVSGELLPQSDDRLLNNSDLAGFNNWQLTLARNEIYARYGRPFDNVNIRAYFQRTGWYTPNSSFRESWLTSTEAKNAEFIRTYQVRVFGTPASRP